MPNAPTPRRQTAFPAGRVVLLAALALLASGCSSINEYTPGFIKPYRPDIQQGNWLTQAQVELLRPGMTREQVRFALGSPTLTSIFHAERWDYPYLFIPGKQGKPEERMFTVHFADGKLTRWEGDPQPDRQPFQTGATIPRAPAPIAPQGGEPAAVDGGTPPASLDPAAQPGLPQ